MLQHVVATFQVLHKKVLARVRNSGLRLYEIALISNCKIVTIMLLAKEGGI